MRFEFVAGNQDWEIFEFCYFFRGNKQIYFFALRKNQQFVDLKVPLFKKMLFMYDKVVFFRYGANYRYI